MKRISADEVVRKGGDAQCHCTLFAYVLTYVLVVPSSFREEEEEMKS